MKAVKSMPRLCEKNFMRTSQIHTDLASKFSFALPRLSGVRGRFNQALLAESGGKKCLGLAKGNVCRVL